MRRGLASRDFVLLDVLGGIMTTIWPNTLWKQFVATICISNEQQSRPNNVQELCGDVKLAKAQTVCFIAGRMLRHVSHGEFPAICSFLFLRQAMIGGLCKVVFYR